MRLTRTPQLHRHDRLSDDRRPRRGPAMPPLARPFTVIHRTRRVGRSRFCTLRPTTDAAATPPMSASVPTPSSAHSSPCPVRCRSTVRRRLVVIAELAVVALVLTGSVSTGTAHADTVVLALADSVTTVLNNVRNWIMGILAGLATVFLSIGGVRYVMGGGDPGEVEKAKTAFKSAGWGYGLAALAPLVVEILKGIVGA